MRTDIAQTIRLKDYRQPDWLVDTVDLDFALHPTQATVRATLKIRPNPQAPSAPLVFDGDGLTLVALKLNGVAMASDSYIAAPDKLTIPQPPNGPFTLEIETLVDPTANTQLSGLYRSSDTYCTQCEAEGFRRITYFPDRPDVMAVYTTRIEADKAQAPVLLANGNLTDAGDLPGGRHFAVWHDPHKKPSYLFALVGGDLACVEHVDAIGDPDQLLRAGHEVHAREEIRSGQAATSHPTGLDDTPRVHVNRQGRQLRRTRHDEHLAVG